MPLLTTLIAGALAAQATPPAGPAMVAAGTIAVARPAPAGRRADPNLVFAEAVESALIDAGFVAIPHTAHARYVATLDVKRTAHGAALAVGASRRGTATSGGIAGGNGVGAGVSIGLGSKTNVGEMVATELSLSITRRGERAPAWEGRAVTYQVSGTRGDEPAALAKKLSTALTRNFASPSGVLVSVP